MVTDINNIKFIHFKLLAFYFEDDNYLLWCCLFSVAAPLLYIISK